MSQEEPSVTLKLFSDQMTLEFRTTIDGEIHQHGVVVRTKELFMSDGTPYLPEIGSAAREAIYELGHRWSIATKKPASYER